MDVSSVIKNAEDAMVVKRVFGDPFTDHGTTLIPVASIRGGAGGGHGDAPEGKGTGEGGGFGMKATPAGAYVVRDGAVCWRPAVDVNKIIVGGQIVAVVALLALRSIVKWRALGAWRSGAGDTVRAYPRRTHHTRGQTALAA